MAQSRDRFSGWEFFTAARVRVLRGLEDQQMEREIAAGLSIEYGTVRRHVEDLKAFTGCGDVRDLGRWWRVNRATWLRWCAAQGGISHGETTHRRAKNVTSRPTTCCP